MINSLLYYSISGFFNGFTALFLVFYIYLRNRRNPINRSFLYFGLSVAGWCLFYSMWLLSNDMKTALWFIRIYMFVCVFIPTTFFHFLVNYSNRYQQYKRLLVLCYGLSIFYAFLFLTPFMIVGVEKKMFFPFWPQNGILLLSYVFIFVITVLGSFALLLNHYLKSSGQEKKQTLLLLIGFFIGFGGGSINWLLWFDIPVPPITHFFVGFTFLIIAYAMVRYGVMDTDVLVEVMRNSRALMMGLISSSINHELRNPLFLAKSKIETYRDMLERSLFKSSEEKDAKTLESMNFVYSQIERASNIIQRLSAFVKPSVSNKEKAVIDIEELVNSVIELIASEHQIQNIRVTRKNLAGFKLAANRGHMEEVFFNLIVNACQSMELSGGELIISASVGAKGEKIIEVSDSGPGISEDSIGKIFDPFVSSKNKGMGLGLYITKLLVEKNNGKISVTTAPEKGTKFILLFDN